MSVPNIIWSYWENRSNLSSSKKIYYDLIWRTVLKNCPPDYQIILLTPDNLSTYVSLTHDIKNIHDKIAYLRTIILYQYGGLWMNIDSLLLRDLEYFFSLARTHHFVLFNYEGSNHNSGQYGSLMISEEKGDIISRLYHQLNDQLEITFDNISQQLYQIIQSANQSQYLLLSGSEIYQLPSQLLAKALEQLNHLEYELLEERCQTGRINICRSDLFCHQLMNEHDNTEKDHLINEIMETALGKLLITAGLEKDLDGYYFHYQDLTGWICPYRRLILIDNPYQSKETRIYLKQKLFYTREQLKSVELMEFCQHQRITIAQSNVVVIIDPDSNYQTWIKYLAEIFYQQVLIHVFSINNLQMIRGLTKSIM